MQGKEACRQRYSALQAPALLCLCFSFMINFFLSVCLSVCVRACVHAPFARLDDEHVRVRVHAPVCACASAVKVGKGQRTP